MRRPTSLRLTILSTALLVVSLGLARLGPEWPWPPGAHQGRAPEGNDIVLPLAVTSDPRPAAGTGASLPPPTEIIRWEEDREEFKRAREEWIEAMHRAPDVDWRAIERENRRALSLERFGRIQRGDLTNQWSEIGSANMAGRTLAAAPSGDGQHLYLGSHLGGVWRGTLEGQDWSAMADGTGLGFYQVLAIPEGQQPEEPEVVFAVGASGGFGVVYATTDLGATWFVPEGLPEDVYEAKRIVRDPANPRYVYLLSRSRQWHEGGGGFDYGFLLSRSTDGGITFQLAHIFPALPKADLWIDRVDGGDLYVLSGATLHVSSDQGETFQALGTIPAGGSVASAILSGSEAGAPTFYAALQVNSVWHIYRSTDAGATWAWRHDPTDWWTSEQWISFDASIVDADILFYGGVECWRSTNGGGSFSKINSWVDYYGDPEHKLHADLPGIDIFWVNDREAVYFNTDGGTYVSYDGGETVQNLSMWGLGVSQYYSIFTSATDPYLVAAGSQDQGYQQALDDDGSHYLLFEQLISGDYGHLASTARDHNWLYSVYPGFILCQKHETSPQILFQINFPAQEHLWMPPILADPFDGQVLYFCGNQIWRMERVGETQIHNSTALPRNFGSPVTGLAISEADPNYWYAAANGYLYYSHDAGTTWTQSGSGPNHHYFYGTALVASPNDRNLAYAGGSGYQGYPVWRTTDGGISWHGMGEGPPSTLVLDLALAGATHQDLYAASEAGPYAIRAEEGVWESLLGTEAPLTVYWAVEWVPEINSVRFGTYGRGIWDYRLPDPADVADGVSGSDPAGSAGLLLYPNPARDRVTLRFQAGLPGEFRGELFDITGRRVSTLLERGLGAGPQEITVGLAAHPLERGVYFVRLVGPDGVMVRKLLVIGTGS